MSERLDKKILKDAFQYVRNELSDLLNNTKYQSSKEYKSISYASLLKNVSDFNNFQEQEWGDSIKEVKSEYYLEYNLSQLALYLHGVLIVIGIKYFLGDEKYAHIPKESHHSLSFFALSYPNIYKSLYETNRLYLQGNDLQGNVMFRNFMELADITILICIDSDFFKEYKRQPENDIDAKKRWAKVRPARVKAQVEAFIMSLSIAEELKEHFMNIRNTIYSDYSKSVHGHIEAQFMSNFKLDKIKAENVFSIWGINHENIKSNFFHLIIYNYYIFIAMVATLINKHGLPMSNFDESGEDFIFHFKFYEKLVKDYISDRF